MNDSSTEEELRLLLEQRSCEVDELRQQIRDLEERGAHFLSDAAHAAMNPLTIIQSYLEILISDLPTGLSAQQIGFIEIAHEAALRMRRVIDGLVEFAALELDAAELQLASVSVEDVVTDLCSAVQPIAERAEIDLSVSISSPIPEVEADADRLGAAVREVLSNALRATPPGGRIAVDVIHENHNVVVRVSDTGPGIPDDQLERVFEVFHRLPRLPGESSRGAGLGLAVARRQIEAIGGRIEVSNHPGAGSTFSLVIPALQGETELIRHSEPPCNP